MSKTRKFITKRIRLTRSGKLLRRKAGQESTAKKSAKKVRSRKRAEKLTRADVKAIKKYI